MTNEMNLNFEKESLYDRSFTCPCCKTPIKSKAIKTGKAKLESTDPDLRPHYSNIDALKYDSILCKHCGYASVRKYFTEPLNPVEQKYIKEKITDCFQPNPYEPELYSYEESIRRYKLAYINCLAKKARSSELAYTCLKTAWVYRGYRLNLIEQGRSETDAKIVELKETEENYLKHALSGLKEAYMTEEPPICGMDQATFSYLVAYLSYSNEDYAESKRWLAKTLVERDASERLKDRARELKHALSKVMEEETTSE